MTKCSLCGGKVVNQKCLDCGMCFNNEQHYHLNTNQDVKRTKRPITKVQHDSTKKVTAPDITTADQPLERRKKNVLGVLITTITVGLAVVGAVAEEGWLERGEDSYVAPPFDIGDSTDSVLEDMDNQFDSIQNDEMLVEKWQTQIDEEFTETGETYEVELEAGDYIGGQQIPTGIYFMEAAEEYDSIVIQDYDRNYFHFLTETGIEFPVFAGTQVHINGTRIQLMTDNGQMESMKEGTPNPLTQEIELEETTKVGDKLPAGTYDIHLVEGTGNVTLFDPSRIAHAVSPFGSSFSVDVYRNLVLKNGDELELVNLGDGNFVMKLVPSETVFE